MQAYPDLISRASVEIGYEKANKEEKKFSKLFLSCQGEEWNADRHFNTLHNRGTNNYTNLDKWNGVLQ